MFNGHISCSCGCGLTGLTKSGGKAWDASTLETGSKSKPHLQFHGWWGMVQLPTAIVGRAVDREHSHAHRS
jgi:hypothetical protein